MTQDEKRRFEMELDIAAPRADVWKAIATSEGLERWFPATAKVVPGEGGEVTWSWGEAYHWPQTIETWEPERRLRTRYDSLVDDGSGGKCPLFVDFILTGDGGTTRLRLVHSGFGPEAEFDEEFDGISGGWPAELRSLRVVLERHPGSSRRLVWTRVAIPLTAADAWQRLTGANGFGCGEGVSALDEGAGFTLRRPGGGAFEGSALACGPSSFAGVVTNLGDAFLRMATECCVKHDSGEIDLWLWLATYDLADAELDAVRRDFDAIVADAFSGVEIRALGADGEAVV